MKSKDTKIGNFVFVQRLKACYQLYPTAIQKLELRSIFITACRAAGLVNDDIHFRIVELINLASASPGMDLMAKEAIYLSCGLTAFHLFDLLNFDSLFRDRLWQEYQDKSQRYY